MISCITPPVALTAYAAAGLAKTDPGKAGWTAFYYGILAYIIPYMFVYSPVLLWQGSLTWITALVLHRPDRCFCLRHRAGGLPLRTVHYT